MLRLSLGCPTRRDLEWYDAETKARHVEVLKAVNAYMNELDRKDVGPDETTSLGDVTRRERPSRR